MLLMGMQKNSLLDYPGKLCATLFTGGCDMRCPFCHNPSLVVLDAHPQALAQEEVLAFLEKRRGVLDGVCITGGEPTLQPDLAAFAEKIKALGYLVKLDTNGNRPEVLQALAEAGLVDYVAMDIKNSPDKYAQTVGFENFDTARVEQSATFLLSGAVNYEFRTTVVADLHNTAAFERIAAWLKGARRYYLQAFEDKGNTLAPGLRAPTRKDMETYADILRPFVQEVGLRGL